MVEPEDIEVPDFRIEEEETELRRKWFLDFSSPRRYPSFPPMARHRDTNVRSHTDGNRVEPLVDGQDYMREWHDTIQAMILNREGDVYHAAWRLDDIQPLGYGLGLAALELFVNANSNGVGIYPLMCRNLLNFAQPNLNFDSMLFLRDHGVSNACLDNRYPARGSNHQKFTYFKNPTDPKAILGSIDITWPRWDTPAHSPSPSGGRHPDEKPTHDLGIKVEGPALADIEWTFRERWNDSSRSLGMRRGRTRVLLPRTAPPMITGPALIPGSVGTCAIQVLHTYGRATRYSSYSWCDAGEFTIWASYLNAIKKARRYIYIEDQYFVPFGWPPWFRQTSDDSDHCIPEHSRQTTRLQRSDLIYQLGQAIRRGVKVAVLVPEATEDADPGVGEYWDYQRSVGAHYLASLALSQTCRGDFVIAFPQSGGSAFFVHSKVMICDDEFVLIGSANINRRSMTHDSEIQLGIVDAANDFARELRKTLWKEHFNRTQSDPSDDLNDPDAAYEMFKRGEGRICPYTPADPGDPRPEHSFIINHVIDPYGGP